MSEIEWRPIPGWEGHYEASSDGQIRSLNRVTSIGRRIKGRMLTPYTRPSGHLVVTLSLDGHSSPWAVHRLVMAATEGPCPPGYMVCHRNGVPDDNRRANLYYGTGSDNQRDRVRHGRDPNASKTHCINGHEFDEANTYYYTGGRICRACRTARERRRYAKAKTVSLPSNNLPG